jgi:AmmeMemoRadiSam system protein A
MLSTTDKSFLLSLARSTIEDISRGLTPEFPDIHSEALKKKAGVFVTLHKSGDLRGCVGYVEGTHSIQVAVRDMAAASAFEDPRFPKITFVEVPLIKIEISVLSPLVQIRSIDEIEIGKHGLIIEKGWNTGLLLPQVATENKWDRKNFLEFTCLKAGLLSDDWKRQDVKIKIFTAEIFSD